MYPSSARRQTFISRSSRTDSPDLPLALCWYPRNALPFPRSPPLATIIRSPWLSRAPRNVRSAVSEPAASHHQLSVGLRIPLQQQQQQQQQRRRQRQEKAHPLLGGAPCSCRSRHPCPYPRLRPCLPPRAAKQTGRPFDKRRLPREPRSSCVGHSLHCDGGTIRARHDPRWRGFRSEAQEHRHLFESEILNVPKKSTLAQQNKKPRPTLHIRQCQALKILPRETPAAPTLLQETRILPALRLRHRVARTASL